MSLSVNSPATVVVAPKAAAGHRPRTYIAKLIVGMRDSLVQLGAKPTNTQLEIWAIFIHESMSISSRNYHSVQHVFDLADGWDDPIGVLSAYFHDCIYYHVDGGLSESQASILDQVFYTKDHKCYLCETIPPDDDLLPMIHSIFGFHEGQEVGPMAGLNEFLSAVIALRELQDVLPRSTLAKIACCIEATIPFRRKDADGRTPMDLLHDRMVLTNKQCGLGLTEAELLEAVQRAAILADRDVGNFGSDDVAYFLDNTWSLLPETNESLRHQYLYTVKEFQHAVFKMHGFFGFISHDIIFCDYKGVPSNRAKLEEKAARNLEIGKKYVGSKLLSISILAAFAALTGGDDAPISLFLGDLPSRHHVSCRLEDYLPEPYGLDLCDKEVYRVLSEGRKSETSFDIRQSPLAAYLYGCMGDERLFEVLAQESLYPMDCDKASRLLRRVPRDCLISIAQNMAKVAVSRCESIEGIIAELQAEAVMPQSDHKGDEN